MKWLRARLSEKSTYEGLAYLGALLSVLAGPEHAQTAGAAVGALMGVYKVLRPDAR